MFYEEIRIKQGLSNISFCPLRILYSCKFIIMATSSRTNAVVVTRVHDITILHVILYAIISQSTMELLYKTVHYRTVSVDPNVVCPNRNV